MSQRTVREDFPVTRRTRLEKAAESKDVVPESPPLPTRKPDLQLSKTEQLQLLKDFDLNLDYGPCLGISRLERWERAKELSLAPPPAIRDLLLDHQDEIEYSECLWQEERGLVPGR